MESEEPVHRHLAELFARIEPQCVLDVGANTGQYGELLRGHGYSGWIVSFEPVLEAFEELTARARDDGRWRAFRLALGAKTERRNIAVTAVTVLSSFRSLNRYAADELPGASEVTHSEEVDVRALQDAWDELLAGLPHDRVFLKLDTQGWDLEVVAGAEGVLDRLVGLQLEASLMPIYDDVPTFTHTVERMTALGFDPTGIFPVNRDSLSRLIEVDCVFVNSRHPDAEQWREDTWAISTQRFLEEVAAAVPAGSPFVLIDNDELGITEIAGRRAVPFVERDGEYYGLPENGDEAVAELVRQTQRGVRHVAIAWSAFWWLEEYPELARWLESDWRRITATDAAIVFEAQ